MEIDSKPESMDILDRRLIQLKIEREAVRKEKDEASKKRMALIEDEIRRLEKEYSDLEEIWKAEKAQVQARNISRKRSKNSVRRLPTCNAKGSTTNWQNCNTASCRS